MREYFGIDVSKETLDVCYLENTFPFAYKRKVFDNTCKGHKALAQWLRKVTGKTFASMNVTLEATGVYHLSIAKYLQARQVYMSVIHPLDSFHYAKSLGMNAKTDGLDSTMLARYGKERNPKEWQPAPEQLIELKALNQRLDMVGRDIQREKNRLESAEIAAYSKAVVRLIKASIRALEKQSEKLVELIETIISTHQDLKKNRELLQSIKGIGDVTSRYLLTEIYHGRFHSASQCAAYFGLIPVPHQSGKMMKTHLSKRGNRKIKAKLYMAAIVAKQHNPVLKQHYDRLIARGKCKMSALCAVMRRLVQTCFGVIKHQKAFCLPA
jgi:transposase